MHQSRIEFQSKKNNILFIIVLCSQVLISRYFTHILNKGCLQLPTDLSTDLTHITKLQIKKECSCKFYWQEVFLKNRIMLKPKLAIPFIKSMFQSTRAKSFVLFVIILYDYKLKRINSSGNKILCVFTNFAQFVKWSTCIGFEIDDWRKYIFDK